MKLITCFFTILFALHCFAQCEGNPCNDGNSCTIDYCYGFFVEESPQTYCFYEDVDCDDHDVCTIDSCNTESGCNYQTISCDDGDSTTIDTCDRLRGCQFTPIVCTDDDDNVCTEPTIDLETQTCYNVDVSQSCEDDGDACTLEYCDTQRGCQITYQDCDDGLYCTINDRCENGECVYDDVECDNYSTCSEDSFGECITNETNQVEQA